MELGYSQHLTILLLSLNRHLQNNNVKWPNFALSREREPQRLIFLNFYFKFIIVSQIQFRHNLDSDKENNRL